MRSRFVGLENSPDPGIWAALDEEVFMTKASFAQLKSRDSFMAANGKDTRFPHALLSIRAEVLTEASLRYWTSVTLLNVSEASRSKLMQ